MWPSSSKLIGLEPFNMLAYELVLFSCPDVILTTHTTTKLLVVLNHDKIKRSQAPNYNHFNS